MIMKHNKLFGGVLLVAGTTIGAGMLALPVVTGFAGFVPSIALFVLYWLFMTFTALLMLEVNLWMNKETNLITMARDTLGKGGAAICWGVYLFLLYALTTAYVAGSGPIIIDMIQSFTGIELPAWTGPIPLLAVFGVFVYKGAHSVDYINRGLMVGLAITFVLMVILITPHVDISFLERSDWKSLRLAVAIVSTSFGFHIIIPTLTHYLHRDVDKCRKTILIGSAIPLVVYVLWELLTLGIIPIEGANSIAEGYRKGADGATLLSALLSNPQLSLIARLFSLFAIVTSFLGVSLSLFDFLADGLNITKSRAGKLMLYGLTFIPPLMLTWTDPRAFLNALEYAGAFGVVILLGILPILMVWSGRYYQMRTSTFRAPGGRFVLAIGLLISFTVIGIEIFNKLNK